MSPSSLCLLSLRQSPCLPQFGLSPSPPHRFVSVSVSGSAMRDVAKAVRSSMGRRKQRLGVADVYARNGGPGDPHDMIYEEVRDKHNTTKGGSFLGLSLAASVCFLSVCLCLSSLRASLLTAIRLSLSVGVSLPVSAHVRSVFSRSTHLLLCLLRVCLLPVLLFASAASLPAYPTAAAAACVHACRYSRIHYHVLFWGFRAPQVRIQFWVVKVLLGAPLTTKLYMHFIKDIKDKSMVRRWVWCACRGGAWGVCLLIHALSLASPWLFACVSPCFSVSFCPVCGSP